ncbi:hypothetical protein GCM10027418_25870 [Mariniluteicoccus endophyticus]
MNKPIVHSSLTEQVRSRVLADLRSGRYDDRLWSVAEVAAELGVSRTPVREVLLQLQESGLIEFRRNRGFTAVQVSPTIVAEVFQVRLSLEVAVTRRVALVRLPETVALLRDEEHAMRESGARGDREGFMAADLRFHNVLLRAAGNRRIEATVAAARDAVFSRGLSTHGSRRTWEDLLDEHRAVADAIEAGDEEAAAASMARHLVNTGEALIARLSGGETVRSWSQGFVPHADGR